MAYEVTATRKRPQDFDRLVGQEFVVSTLENAIQEGRIAHAYLFAGPRGVGKTSSARLLAKSLNCERGMSAHPCGECSSCREIKAGTSLDVIEIDGASNTSVNDVRKIKEEVLFPPQSSRYKIYIIDEVHMLSGSAFNALLKTIEEPPEYVIFIFATTEIQKVPATIKSRCQVFRFQLIAQEKIQACLKEAAEDLGIEADEDALFWISKEATGSMRDAYTLFDQVASFSGNHITLDKIRERLNLAGFSKISEMVSASLRGEPGKAVEILSSLLQSGVSTEQITKDGADFFRSLLLYKNGIRRPSLLGVEEAEIPSDIVELLSREQLEAGLRGFMNLYRDLRYTLSPQFELELLFSRLSSLPSLVSGETLVRKLEDMKKGIAEGEVVIKKKAQRVIETTSSTPAPATKENATSAPAAADVSRAESAPVSSPSPREEEPKREEKPLPLSYTEEEEREETVYDSSLLEKIIGELDPTVSSILSTALKDARIERLGDFLVITVNNEMGRDLLEESRAGIEKAILGITGEKLSLRAVYNPPKEVVYSEKMRTLQSIFGGKIVVNTEEKEKKKQQNEQKKTETVIQEEKPKEIHENDESVRNESDDEEFAGVDGEDEDSEGED
jgi:DNA polymerase III subunit gamma/tau